MKCWDCGKEIEEDKLRCEVCSAGPIEFSDEKMPGSWTRRTNAERELYKKDILQARKKNGSINKDFVQVYGTKTIEKEFKMSRKDILRQVDKYG